MLCLIYDILLSVCLLYIHSHKLIGLCLGYSGLINGGPHPEDHNGAPPSPSPHNNTPLTEPMGRGGPIQSTPVSTGGVLQYADGPPRILPEEGQNHQGGESDTEPQDGELRRRIFFSSSSSSSSSSSLSGSGGSAAGGSRLHYHTSNSAKQGYHSNHGNHHHQSPGTQYTHPPSHVSSSHSTHSLGSQEGRKRGRRKRSSAVAVTASGSPKRRSFPGLSSNNHSSGSPLNINSMVSHRKHEEHRQNSFPPPRRGCNRFQNSQFRSYQWFESQTT